MAKKTKEPAGDVATLREIADLYFPRYPPVHREIDAIADRLEAAERERGRLERIAEAAGQAASAIAEARRIVWNASGVSPERRDVINDRLGNLGRVLLDAAE